MFVLFLICPCGIIDFIFLVGDAVNAHHLIWTILIDQVLLLTRSRVYGVQGEDPSGEQIKVIDQQFHKI